MSIVRRFDGSKLEILKIGEAIWFKGKDVALALGYERPRDAIDRHVDSDCKLPFSSLEQGSRVQPGDDHERDRLALPHCDLPGYRFHPDIIIVPGLGEMQDTGFKRRDAYREGYAGGQPDITLANCHTHYRGFAIEFKTPKGSRTLSENQSKQLADYTANGYKTLISNDYAFML